MIKGVGVLTYHEDGDCPNPTRMTDEELSPLQKTDSLTLTIPEAHRRYKGRRNVSSLLQLVRYPGTGGQKHPHEGAEFNFFNKHTFNFQFWICESRHERESTYSTIVQSCG